MILNNAILRIKVLSLSEDIVNGYKNLQIHDLFRVIYPQCCFRKLNLKRIQHGIFHGMTGNYVF